MEVLPLNCVVTAAGTGQRAWASGERERAQPLPRHQLRDARRYLRV
jgi:hypothetical protein